jgi:alanine-glyoxylate transaminase/serine-glyoxylate transaminase/serine-pyruvate transaminase
LVRGNATAMPTDTPRARTPRGRLFFANPGPTNIPDSVLHAVAHHTVDFNDAAFCEIYDSCVAGLKRVLKTRQHLFLYNASGHGAWEASLVNLLSPGDRVLMLETGYFSDAWMLMAKELGLEVQLLRADWRLGVDLGALRDALAADTTHAIKAVCVVHNETSTAVTSRIDQVRAAIDRAHHPALLMVDTISSLGSIDYRHDEWGVDVTVGGSQKGLMLPPGLSFNALSDKALAAAKQSRLPKSYWSWEEMLGANKNGYFPYTPATNLLYGLRESLTMLLEDEGLENVFRRHDRHAEATRQAVRAWGLELQCANPAEYSSSLTAVQMPSGHSEIALRKTVLEHFDMSLGSGLGKITDKVFRIGHLGDFNDLMVTGTLSGVEMGLKACGVPHRSGGVEAAMAYLGGNHGRVAEAAE